MTEAQIRVLISVVSIVVTLVFSYAAYVRLKKKDAHEDGERTGSLMIEIGYIKAGIDDLKRDNGELRHKYEDHETRIARTEESVKQAHKRLDKLEEIS